MYRVISAKVTFGNIHASDSPVDHVHRTIVPSPATPPRSINLSQAAGLDFNTSDTKSLLADDDSESPIKLDPVQSSQKASAATCLVDESVFKIPTGYKCTNRDYSSLGFVLDNRSASSAVADNVRYNQSHPPVDDDEIMLQIAIQQSLAAEQLTAGVLPTARDSSGGTQSLQEYQSRQSSLAFSQGEDLLLQK